MCATSSLSAKKKVKSVIMKASGLPPLLPLDAFVGTRLKDMPRASLGWAYLETLDPVKEPMMHASQMAAGKDS